MQTKKVISLGGLLLFLILFSGCGGSSSETKDSKIANESATMNKKAQKNIAKDAEKEVAKSDNSLNKKNSMNTQMPKAPVINQELIKKYPFATIKTSMGDIKVKFNGTVTPLTVTNFLQLAEAKFYDNVKFHRVIKGFMIQGGDPLSKDDAMKNSWGTGGPGYKFKDELVGTEEYSQGTLAMANSGPDTNGSQFFIVTANPGVQLPPSYTVFGKVVSGIDVALEIENAKTEVSDRPVEDVAIESVSLLDK